MDKKLHIISFNVPYPADYGGVIDIFYKIKALVLCGVKVQLHCFSYGRKDIETLKPYCETIYTYPRKRNPIYLFSHKPFIIKSRANKNLLNNLLVNDYPILFEGFHSCYYLNHPQLKQRLKLVRIHNIEHVYYQNLALIRSNFLKKLYFLWEAKKLKNYEQHLQHADSLLVISKCDKAYYRSKFKTVNLITPFHTNDAFTAKEAKYKVIYNADFTINSNKLFAESLIKAFANNTLVLAGKSFSQDLFTSENLIFKANPSDQTLVDLMQNTEIHIVNIDIETGFKLKLVNALYTAQNIIIVGKYVPELDFLLNDHVKYIENLDYIKEVIRDLKPATLQQIENSRKAALTYFNNNDSALAIVELLESKKA